MITSRSITTTFYQPTTRTQILNLRALVFCLAAAFGNVGGNPSSKAYIPFRTDPYDQPISKNDPSDFRSDSSDDHKDFNNDRRQFPPRFYEPDKATEPKECPLQFSLGLSHRSHATVPGLGGNAAESPLGIQQPPIIYPILPWEGPGRQVLFTTQYEHLDMLTPSKGNTHISLGGDDDDTSYVKEGLTENVEFPLLFESSAFQTSPVIADVNGDGLLDAILTDYHGGLYVIGLHIGQGQNHRYYMKSQVPRMYVRRQWMEAMVNETMGIDPYEAEKKSEEEEKKAEEARKAARDAAAADAGDVEPKDETEDDRDYNRYRMNEERPHDPYHSYFEYSYGSGNADHEPILRGVTANVLEQDHNHVQGLEERRNRNHYSKDGGNQRIVYDSYEEEKLNEKVLYDSFEEDKKNQKIIYDSFDSPDEEHEADHRRLEEVIEGGEEEAEGNTEVGQGDDIPWGGFADDLQLDDDIVGKNNNEDLDDIPNNHVGDGDGDEDTSFVSKDDDIYPRHDDYPRYDDHHQFDDFYHGRYSDLHEDYFDDKHYIRLPPHILSTPVLAELPKLYSNNGETENLLFVGVSYYFDEDEYDGFFSYKRFENSDHGDETETERGMYIANAIMIFHLGENPRWGE